MNIYITGFSSCTGLFKNSFVCSDPDSSDIAKLVVYRGSNNNPYDGITLQINQTHYEEVDDETEKAERYIASAHLSQLNAIDLLLSLADKLDFTVITTNKSLGESA